MSAVVLALLLASAAEPTVGVVSVGLDGPGEPRAAEAVAGALKRWRVEAQVRDLREYLSIRSSTCAAEVGCLCAAPALADDPYTVVVVARPPRGGRRVGDLRILDCAHERVAARSSVVVDEREWLGWHARRIQQLWVGANLDTGDFPGARILPGHAAPAPEWEQSKLRQDEADSEVEAPVAESKPAPAERSLTRSLQKLAPPAEPPRAPLAAQAPKPPAAAARAPFDDDLREPDRLGTRKRHASLLSTESRIQRSALGLLFAGILAPVGALAGGLSGCIGGAILTGGLGEGCEVGAGFGFWVGVGLASGLGAHGAAELLKQPGIMKWAVLGGLGGAAVAGLALLITPADHGGPLDRPLGAWVVLSGIPMASAVIANELGYAELPLPRGGRATLLPVITPTRDLRGATVGLHSRF